MDIWGCQEPTTKFERIMLYVMAVCFVACWVLGLPFLFLIAFGVIQ